MRFILIFLLFPIFSYSQAVKIGEFNKVKVYDGIRVTIIPSESDSLLIEGKNKEHVSIKLKNGSLQIRMDIKKIFSGFNTTVALFNSSPIEEKMKHCTVKEILATKAERQSIKFMQVVYISKEIGNIFKGVISGVVERGIYVEINENKCEGMVNIRSFPKGYFLYNESSYSFEDEQQKLIFQLGDSVFIEVINADIIKRHIDFKLIGHS